uniref:Superoxide dismutase n=1 Tax=Globodera pallida TaxID=36090 RepID=A0A183C426_GLOPA
MDENYQILKEMHDRLLNTNEHWHFIVGGAGVEPNCKAFMEKIREYFTEDSAQLVSDTDPNVTEMVTFTQVVFSIIFKRLTQIFPLMFPTTKIHCFRAEHGVSNAVFSSSQMLRKFLLPRAIRWQEVRLSKYIIIKAMHDRLLSNRVWCYSLIGVADINEDCKAFMDRLNYYLTDASILKQKAVCVLFGDTDPTVKGMITFTQDSMTTPVTITGQISGLSPGAHGFHVHEFGDLRNGSTAGPHFNPINKSHGGPSGEFRHVRLLGNVHAGADGVAKFEFTGSGISLSGAHNIVGRTLVVHKLEDVLCHGLHGEEQKNKMTTDNAATCLACGAIMIGIGRP